jgi:hypothetical protein
MNASTSEILWQILAPALKLLALSGSLAGVALGVCLIVRSEATLRYLRGMNRWVSSRRAMKSLEIPRNVERAAHRGGRGIGIVVAAIGAYALVVLALQFDPGKLASVLGEHPRYSIAAIVIDGVRWILVAGCATAVVAGLMLVFAPRALATLETLGNRWISSRQMATGGDTMRVPLDRFAEHYPRAAGIVITALSAAAAVASVVLHFSRPIS